MRRRFDATWGSGANVRARGALSGPISRHPGSVAAAPTRWTPVTVLAHRGGSGPWPENTLEAFAGALRAGADGVELDVRRCADGELVVHHDAEVPGVGAHPPAPGATSCRRGSPPSSSPSPPARGRSSTWRSRTSPPTPATTPPTRWPSTSPRSWPPRSLGRAAPWPAHVVVSSFWPDTLAAVGRGRAARAPRAPLARRVLRPRHRASASGAWRSIPITPR